MGVGTLVVYHYNPTSNRNAKDEVKKLVEVVYHYNPTSNRNMTLFARLS